MYLKTPQYCDHLRLYVLSIWSQGFDKHSFDMHCSEFQYIHMTSSFWRHDQLFLNQYLVKKAKEKLVQPIYLQCIRNNYLSFVIYLDVLTLSKVFFFKTVNILVTKNVRYPDMTHMNGKGLQVLLLFFNGTLINTSNVNWLHHSVSAVGYLFYKESNRPAIKLNKIHIGFKPRTKYSGDHCDIENSDGISFCKTSAWEDMLTSDKPF